MNIIICADDFAQNHAVSEGILELIADQRLSATSCLTTSRYWVQHAVLLKKYIGKIDIGLHFNLTEGQPLTDIPCLVRRGEFAGLFTTICKSQAGLLDQAQIVTELTAQINAFKTEMGCLPDYIDGHQHIHQLPIIREALIAVYKKIYQQQRAYVRLLQYKPCDFKHWVLKKLGAKQVKHLLQTNNIAHNTSFSGIYNLQPNVNYPKLFKRFATESQNNGIIMCHPGKASHDMADPIAATRVNEFNYLISEQFLMDCQTLNFQPSRFVF